MTYYEPRGDVIKTVATKIVEKNEVDLVEYYLRMAYQYDQHTYMNDLRWILDNKFEDCNVEEVKENTKEMLESSSEDDDMFEDILTEEE